MRICWSVAVGGLLFGCTKQETGQLSTPANQESSNGRHATGAFFNPPLVDLGKLPLGSSQNFSATLCNSGNQTLDIAEVQTTCCMVLKSEARELRPGESATFSGTFRIGKDPGLKRGEIRVFFKGYRTDPLSLEIRALSERTIKIDPEMLLLTPDVRLSRPVTTVLDVTNKSDTTIQVHGISGLPAGVHVSLDTKNLHANETVKMRVTAEPIFVQSLAAELVLLNSHPAEGSVQIPLFIEPPERLHCEPKEFRFGIVSRKDLADFTVIISGELLQSLSLKNVTVPPFLQLVETATATPGSLEARFRFHGGYEAAVLRGSCVLEFSSKAQATPGVLRMEIPVSGVLRD